MIGLLVFNYPCFQVVRVALEELGILLRILLCFLAQEPQNPACHSHAQLLHQASVLHTLTADVQWHVLTIHNTLDPMQPFWNDTISRESMQDTRLMEKLR